jgi:hypothetical protein
MFPKTFGGYSGDVYIRQIDLYNNNMVVAGNSFDNSLLPILSPYDPIIGVINLS